MHDWIALKEKIRGWGAELGFAAIGFAAVDLGRAEAGLQAWLAAGCHGEMDYMARHGLKRARPADLLPGTAAIITCRMNYLPAAAPGRTPLHAAVSRYALGRDYHKLLRQRLGTLLDQIVANVGDCGARIFVDSAPVMEVELARNAGLGWRGKHTLLLTREAGSWFFLGEIFLNLSLPPDSPVSSHCGDCQQCIDICPSQAIIAPYRLDARRCIAYLTIEHKGSIPEAFRPLLGNRIYGCDDCQLVCPWNRFASLSSEADFAPRQGLDQAQLTELFAWSENDFKQRLNGSAIRRIGHERWLRNISVALGNAPSSPAIVAALQSRQNHPSALVREHVGWALAQHQPG